MAQARLRPEPPATNPTGNPDKQKEPDLIEVGLF